MMRVNLIPLERRHRMRCRVHLRGWILAGAAYLLLLGVASVTAGMAWARDDGPIRDELALVSEKLARSQSQHSAVRSELTETTAVLEAQRAVGDQPDWAILLALLDDIRGDEIVFRRILLSPVGDEGRTTEQSAAQIMRLVLEGYGRTQPDVSGFVLRLEQVVVFDKVKLIDTRREPFLADHAVAFRVECMIRSEGTPTP